MSRPVYLAPWPPETHGAAVPMTSTVPFEAARHVIVVCHRHVPPQVVDAGAALLLGFMIYAAFRALPDVKLECGLDDGKLAIAAAVASPLCCTLGEARLTEIARQIPAIWALRS